MSETTETVAVEACLAGGRYLRNAFATGDTDATYLAYDVKSSADTESERRMLAVLEESVPEHRIDAEESGTHAGDDDRRWIVDPLDGTNNFEAGLPTFATAATYLVDDEPEVAVSYAPVPDDLYVAVRGDGMRYKGRPVNTAETAASDDGPPASAATVMSVIGHDVKRDPETAAVSERINRDIETRCKRRLESWSPALHWGLLARGRIDGAVSYRPDAEEQRLGELFVREAGLETASGAEWFVAARTDSLREELLAVVETAGVE
ncbi:inositol monophosphatase family protein [Natronomonas gomsonensis]|uniref:inositol monophosphatase family protein n=1 Tax=Natronomonas gomsonensis TaxID=1046043 RepID=UPI0015B84BDF|nr:inositol monophosphatase family protein [Natronomonas gomsonensis]